MNREKSAYSVKTGIYDFKVDDVNKSKRTVMFIGNTYNYMDSQLDVAQEGMCKMSILMGGPKSKDGPKIKFCLNHDMTVRPGKFTELCEKEMNIKGENMMCLYAEVQFTDNSLGNDTLADYLDEKIDQHSIGYEEVKVVTFDPLSPDEEELERWEEFKKTFRNPEDYEKLAAKCWYKDVQALKEIRLFEISGVGYGANQLTPYLGSKSMNPETFDLSLSSMESKLTSMITSLGTYKGEGLDDAIHVIKIHLKQMKAMRNEIYGRESIKKYLAEEFNCPIKDITCSDIITENVLEQAAKNFKF